MDFCGKTGTLVFGLLTFDPIPFLRMTETVVIDCGIFYRAHATRRLWKCL